jgi:hypothetical protein
VEDETMKRKNLAVTAVVLLLGFAAVTFGRYIPGLSTEAAPAKVDYVEIMKSTLQIGDERKVTLSALSAHIEPVIDADGIVLLGTQLNGIGLGTGAGDWDIPVDMCDTANGNWFTLKSSAAHVNSLTSNDASDLFVLANGTALDAGDELDTAGAAGNSCTVACLQANTWWVIAELGTCADGGVAD